MNIVLVDATTYEKEIDSELRNLKVKFFKIKNYVKHLRYGEHIPPRQKTYSIGLLRIATILRYNGHNVEYVEFNSLTRFLREWDFYPDIIAYSAVCPTVPVCSEQVEVLRKWYPKVKFVLGGAQVNVAPKTTKRLFPNFDLYSVGYDLEAAEQIVNTKLRPVDDVYADFAILPYEISEYAINTFSTLGCPFACNYCQDRLMPHKPVYADGNIPFFMKHLKDKSCVHFFDSVLGGGNERHLLKVCDAIKKTGHSFLLSCDFRAEMVNVHTIKALSEAGFREIRLGAESADDNLLRQNERYLTRNRLAEAIRLIREQSDIYISLYSAVGFPGSTRENILATIDMFSEFLETRMIDEVKNCIFVPYPFDEHRYGEEELAIRDFNWKHYDRQSIPVYDLKDLSSEDVWELYLLMTDSINKSWQKGFSLEDDIIKKQPLYGEYIIKKYL